MGVLDQKTQVHGNEAEIWILADNPEQLRSAQARQLAIDHAGRRGLSRAGMSNPVEIYPCRADGSLPEAGSEEEKQASLRAIPGGRFQGKYLLTGGL